MCLHGGDAAAAEVTNVPAQVSLILKSTLKRQLASQQRITAKQRGYVIRNKKSHPSFPFNMTSNVEQAQHLFKVLPNFI